MKNIQEKLEEGKNWSNIVKCNLKKKEIGGPRVLQNKNPRV